MDLFIQITVEDLQCVSHCSLGWEYSSEYNKVPTLMNLYSMKKLNRILDSEETG